MRSNFIHLGNNMKRVLAPFKLIGYLRRLGLAADLDAAEWRTQILKTNTDTNRR